MASSGIRTVRTVATAFLGAGLVLALLPAAASAVGPALGPAAASTITVPGVPDAVAVDPATDTAYVADPPDTVAVIDLATSTIAATIPVGSRPGSIAVDPVTDVIYVVNYNDGTVSVIDGATNSVTQTITTGARSSGIAVDPATDQVYVGIPTGVLVIDGATDAVTATITGPESFCEGVAVDPATDTVYAAYRDLVSDILVINGATNTVTKVIQDDPADGTVVDPLGIVADPATNTFYTDNYAESVSAYSGATDTLTSTASVGGLPTSIAENPGTDTVYVTVAINVNNISLLDGAAKGITGTIPLTYFQVAVDPATDTLVAAGPGSHNVSVIPLQAPAITTGDQATFTTGAAASFTAHATGTPVPVISETGALPAGLTMDQGILGGIPKGGTGGVHRFTITASNGVAPAASQTFTLTVDQAPAITTTSRVGFKVGADGSFTLRTSGFPTATVTRTGHMPRGLYFRALPNGTATITGVPAKSDRNRSYVLEVTARNGVGRAAVQRLTLVVR